MLLKDGKVFVPGGLIEADVLVEAGKVARISRGISGAEEAIDCSGKLVLPGLIDAHVHFREPGFTKKEDFDTGSQAALAGGVTTVFDQPNTKPQPTDAKRIREKIKAAKKSCRVNFNINAGVGSSNIAELHELKRYSRIFGEIFMCESVGDLVVNGTADFVNAMNALHSMGAIPTVHAENQEINAYFAEKLKREKRPDVHCDARPPISEVEAVSRACALSPGRLHLCHVSTAESLSIIRYWRGRGKHVTCEVAPHHLFLSREDMHRLKSFGKMNPPLRPLTDRQALWEGVHNGTVDMIATDHAPHTLDEKNDDIWGAPSGIPGIETMLPLLLNEIPKGNMSISRLVELTSEMPARVFGLVGKGMIAEGNDADLVVVDPGADFTVKRSGLYTKCGWSPFEGRKLRGRPVATIVGGEIGMLDGEIRETKGECLNERYAKAKL